MIVYIIGYLIIGIAITAYDYTSLEIKTIEWDDYVKKRSSGAPNLVHREKPALRTDDDFIGVACFLFALLWLPILLILIPTRIFKWIFKKILKK